MVLKQCCYIPYEIYHMVHILMLLWQHTRFQSPASSKLNITICDSTRQNTGSYLRRMPALPSLDLLFNFFNCKFCPMQLQMAIFDFEEEGTGRETILRLTWCTQNAQRFACIIERFWTGSVMWKFSAVRESLMQQSMLIPTKAGVPRGFDCISFPVGNS